MKYILRTLSLSLLMAASLPVAAQSPQQQIETLLNTGQVDAAAKLLAKQADPNLRLLRLRVALQRQDYAQAGPLVQPLLAQASLSGPERALVYVWLFAHDDAAQVEQRSRAMLRGPEAQLVAADLQAAGQLALDQLQYDRAEAQFHSALQISVNPAEQAQALKGLGQVSYKRLAFDKSLRHLQDSVARDASADALTALAATLIRLGRTDEAIDALERAVARNPYHEEAHYYLGNGYARKNYTELARAKNCKLNDAAKLVRRASDAFMAGDYTGTRDLSFAALAKCPDYGRAHNALSKALQFQRFAIDIHRADYERRFAEMDMPVVPGIEKYVLNWATLSPRHQKRVALSVAPWKAFVPVLIAGGSTHYIKPLYMKLSETPGMQSLKNQRINTDTRLWDDVRGAGGFTTVTGIEDVEKTIFDSYNTVLHELTHQVHGVLTADQVRDIQEHYRRAKERNTATGNAFLSRYASGTVWEYFAEGANALASPKRDEYDPREVVRERLTALDPELQTMVQKYLALTDVGASLPIAYVNAGNDQLEKGRLAQALPHFARAMGVAPNDESVQSARLYALMLQGKSAITQKAAQQAATHFPASGTVQAGVAEALWHSGQPLAAVTQQLAQQRDKVQAEDRYLVDLALGAHYWRLGDATESLASYERVLAYQSDNPEALWGKASALALAQRWDEAFASYDKAVRLRPGVVELRNDMARDLLRAKRLEQAKAQLDAARLIEPGNPTSTALQAWLAVQQGDAKAGLKLAATARKLAPWNDMARIAQATAQRALGQHRAALQTLQPLQARIAQNRAPIYVYRAAASSWVSVQELPALERSLVAELARGK